MILSFLLAPDNSPLPLPLRLYCIGCHEQHYVLRPDGHSFPQLFWVYKGKGSVNFLNGRKLVLEQGQGLYLPREIPHEYYALGNEPWVLAFIGINGSAADGIAAGCGLPVCTPFRLRSVDDLMPGLEQLWLEVSMGAPGREREYSRQLYSLLLAAGENMLPLYDETAGSLTGLPAVGHSDGREALHRHAPDTGPAAPRRELPRQELDAASPALSSAEASLLQTLRYMQDHYSEPLSMANLAGAVGYSVQHFQRIFKRAYGITPHAYLQRIRLQHSVDWLLRQPDLTVKEVSARLGWEPNYYIRVFRSEFGMPPAAYRQARLRRAAAASAEPKPDKPT